MTTVRVRFQPGLKPIIEKHQQHDQQSHGNWAGGGQITSEQKQAVQAYTQTIKTNLQWRDVAQSIRDGKTPNATPEFVSSVKNLLNALDEHSVTPTNGNGKVLLRSGINWKGKLPAVGDVMSNPFSSATWRNNVAEKFAQSGDGKPVIVKYGSSTKGLDVSKFGADFFGGEGEFIVSGKFEVVGRDKENGFNYVSVRQVADVAKHQQHDQSTHGSWATGYKLASLDDLPDLDGFSRDVLDAKTSYMGKGYEWMNSFLRDGYIEDKLETGFNFDILSKEEGIRQIVTLENALYSVQTKQDLTVTRVQRTGESITGKKISEMTDKDIADLEGKMYVAKGFTSTFAPKSLHPSVKDSFHASASVLINIQMPEGTYGATIGNNRESEFVLPPNTSFLVTSAKRVGTDKLSIDLLVREQNQYG